MGSITDAFAEAWRDYVTDGVPASGPNEPAKSEIRAIGPLIEASLGALSLGSISVTKDTQAHLFADLAHAANAIGLVYADATDANNDLYVKVGASGTGSWTLTSILHDAISGLAQPFVDECDADVVLTHADVASANTILASVDTAGTTQVAAVNAAGATQVGLIAAASPSIAQNTAALAGFSAAGETIGTAPATDAAGTANVLIFVNVASTYDSTLDSFTASIRSVGNGTARLVVCINAYGTNQVAIIGEVNLTGIASTGVKTFVAGVDYPIPLTANGDPMVFPAGSRVALGSATGGVSFDAHVNTGAGFNVLATASGYNVTQNTGSNLIGKFQVTWGRVKSVRTAVNELANLPVALPGENMVTEYCGPDSLLFDSVGDQSIGFQLGNGFGFYNDGQVTAAQYCSVVAGDVFWLVYRGNVVVDWRRATLTLGDRLTSAFATPIPCKAGDTLQCLPVSGRLKSRTWSAQPGQYPGTNATWAATAFSSLNNQVGCRAVVVRARKVRKIAAASTRGSTVTLDQRFRGTTLPGNTTFTATTTSGSNVLTGITGTPIVGAFIAGTGLTAAALPFILSISGNTAVMSQPATANGTITVTQTGWAAGGTGTWTQNNGLISPSSASTDWSRRYMAPGPINAHRRTFTAAVYVGDLTNIGGLCSQAQQASVVTDLGSVILVDAPANTFRLYRWGANVGIAPPDAGLSVACPWTLAATDWVLITTQIDRGKQTVTFTNAKTGQSAQIISRWSKGSVNPAIHGGVFSGQPGAHFLQGNGGMVWDFMRNITHVANRGPRKFWAGDSTHHMTSDNWDYGWVPRMEDQRGKGDFLNFSKGGQTPQGQLFSLPQDFVALNPGPGDELFWPLGVNPDSNLGSTDALRYASYKASTLAAINICLATGCTFTPVTPTPANFISTYVALLVSNLIAGDLGNYPAIDVGRAVSSGGDGASWTALYSADNLHPFEETGAPLITANFLAQRPDMNGDV